MTDFQWSEPYQVMTVTETIDGAHPQHIDYPLLPEDCLQLYTDGTWAKISPGLMVTGFVLNPEQVQTLKPVWMKNANLAYHIIGDVAPEDVDPALTQVLANGHGYDF